MANGTNNDNNKKKSGNDTVDMVNDFVNSFDDDKKDNKGGNNDKSSAKDYLLVAGSFISGCAILGPAFLVAALAILLVGLIARKGFDYFNKDDPQQVSENITKAAQENSKNKLPTNELEKFKNLSKDSKDFEQYAKKLEGYVNQVSNTPLGKSLLQNKALNSLCQQYFDKDCQELANICKEGKLIEEAKKVDLLNKQNNEKKEETEKLNEEVKDQTNKEPKEVEEVNINKDNSHDVNPGSINEVEENTNEEPEIESEDKETPQEEAPEESKGSGIGGAILGALKTVGKAIWSGIKTAGKAIGKGIKRLVLGEERFQKSEQKIRAKQAAKVQTQKSNSNMSKDVEKIKEATLGDDKEKQKSEPNKDNNSKEKDKGISEGTIKAGFLGFTASMVALGAPVTLAIVAIIALIGIIKGVYDHKNGKSEPENAIEGAHEILEKVNGKEKTPSLVDCLALTKDKNGKSLSKEEFTKQCQGIFQEFAKTEKGKEILNNPAIASMAKNVLGVDLNKDLGLETKEKEKEDPNKQQELSNNQSPEKTDLKDNNKIDKEQKEINEIDKGDKSIQKGDVPNDFNPGSINEVEEDLNISAPVDSNSMVKDESITTQKIVVEEANKEFYQVANEEELAQSMKEVSADKSKDISIDLEGLNQGK